MIIIHRSLPAIYHAHPSMVYQPPGSSMPGWQLHAGLAAPSMVYQPPFIVAAVHPHPLCRCSLSLPQVIAALVTHKETSAAAKLVPKLVAPPARVRALVMMGKLSQVVMHTHASACTLWGCLSVGFSVSSFRRPFVFCASASARVRGAWT